MAQSENLKLFKRNWAQNCQSMWSELLCITIAESFLISNYSSIPNSALLTGLFYCPELSNRLGDLRKDTFLERAVLFRNTIVANRIVFLSAAYETYFRSFLNDYIELRPSLFNSSLRQRTEVGNKLYGDTNKARGMVEKIETFATLACRSTKSFDKHYSFLSDLNILRNSMAHDAGHIDADSCQRMQNYTLPPDSRIQISSNQIVELASRTILIAEGLDKKLATTRN